MKHPLRNSIWTLRDARLALVARSLSTAGTSLTTIAGLLLLHDAGVGPLGIAAFLAAIAIPSIAVMGIAGRIADSADSRAVLAVCAFAQALACVLLGIFPIPTAIYTTAVVIALAQALSQPTWGALIPRVVGEDRIGAAVAWQQGLNAVAGPTGAALGGVLVTLGQVRWGFWLDAATYVVLAAAALAIRERRGGNQHGPLGTPGGWTVGIRTVAQDRMVWPIFVAILVFVVLVEGVNPVEIFLARDELDATAWQYGLSEFFAGAGGVAGAAIAARVARNDQRARLALAGFGGAALCLATAGLAPGFWVYAAIVAVLSATFAMGNATFGALLISRTPDSHRGRVYAALGGLARTASLVALVLGGVANAALGPRLTFVAAGLAGVLVMLVASVRVRRAQIEDRRGLRHGCGGSRHPTHFNGGGGAGA